MRDLLLFPFTSSRSIILSLASFFNYRTLMNTHIHTHTHTVLFLFVIINMEINIHYEKNVHLPVWLKKKLHMLFVLWAYVGRRGCTHDTYEGFIHNCY